MLLNLSNHPAEAWPEKQREAAGALFRRVKDLAFPPVPPDAGTEAVRQLAREYRDKCLRIINLSGDEHNAVHIMGEMTFCFSLVNMLQDTGVKCVASTSHRVAREGPNGDKISTFVFEQFREYPG